MNKIDVIKLAEMLLPTLLRKKRIFSLIKIMLNPFCYVETLCKYLSDYYSQKIYLAQVIQIEYLLNKTYHLDNDIFISDAVYEDQYLYNDSETNMAGIILYNDNESGKVQFLYNDDETSYAANFYVNVPAYLQDQYSEIKLLVEANKITGKSFLIRYYE